MKLVVLKCPECNATVRTGEDATRVRCDYCGAEALVQRRAGILRRPLRVDADPGGPTRVATEVATWWAYIPVAALLLGMLAPPVIGVVLCNVARVDQARREADRLRPRWGGRGVLVADVNGDGTADIVGSAYQLGSPKNVQLIAAVDGAGGKLLWLAPLPGEDRGVATLAGGLVVHGAGAKVMGIGLRDGRVRWSATLDEKVQGLCAGDDGASVLVRTADERLHPLKLADGHTGPARAAAGAPCRPAEHGDPEQDRPDRLICKSYQRGELVVGDRIAGMSSDLALQRPSANVLLALGHKAPGSRVPMIAAYRWPTAVGPAEQPGAPRTAADALEVVRRLRQQKERQPTVLWKTAVPAGDPLAAEERDLEPRQVDLDARTVLAVYPVKGDDRSHRLTAFSLETGKRLWDVAIGEASHPTVALTPSHAVVSDTNLLLVVDRRTGKVVHVMRG